MIIFLLCQEQLFVYPSTLYNYNYNLCHYRTFWYHFRRRVEAIYCVVEIGGNMESLWHLITRKCVKRRSPILSPWVFRTSHFSKADWSSVMTGQQAERLHSKVQNHRQEMREMRARSAQTKPSSAGGHHYLQTTRIPGQCYYIACIIIVKRRHAKVHHCPRPRTCDLLQVIQGPYIVGISYVTFKGISLKTYILTATP